MARVDYPVVTLAGCATFPRVTRAVLVGGSSAGPATPTPPTVTNVAPANGTIIREFTTLSFDVVDNVALSRVIVLLRYPSLNLEELVHSGGEFTANYAASTRTEIDKGFRYVVRRTGNWPSTPRIVVYAFDTEGTESA